MKQRAVPFAPIHLPSRSPRTGTEQKPGRGSDPGGFQRWKELPWTEADFAEEELGVEPGLPRTLPALPGENTWRGFSPRTRVLER